MKLINKPKTAEGELSESVISNAPGDMAVYGAGPVDLGESFEQLLAAHQAGELLGTVGLVITEAMVSRYSADIRQHVGALMQLGKSPTVADPLSAEWALHLGFRAQQETYVGWAASDAASVGVLCDAWGVPWAPGWAFYGYLADAIPKHCDLACVTGYVAIDDVGIAMACAILDLPCLLYATQVWGSHHNRQYSPLLRWARDAGVEQNMVWSLDELREKMAGEIAFVPRSLVNERRSQALGMLAVPEKDPLTEALGPVEVDPPPPGQGRVLELGSMFDPETHYGPEYYGGEKGIRFCRPDGTWDTYHSTAHNWSGFAKIAGWLNRMGLVDGDGFALDLGCGAGGFVNAMQAFTSNAYGVDISKAAVERGREMGIEHLKCGDITGELAVSGLGYHYEMISALDLWEHIAEPDVNVLCRAVREWLAPGGIGFFNICTRGDIGEKDYTFIPPVEVTKENAWLLVAGHLTIRRWGWWIDKFDAHGLKPRFDLMQQFQVLRCEDPATVNLASWSPRNVIFVQRV